MLRSAGNTPLPLPHMYEESDPETLNPKYRGPKTSPLILGKHSTLHVSSPQAEQIAESTSHESLMPAQHPHVRAYPQGPGKGLGVWGFLVLGVLGLRVLRFMVLGFRVPFRVRRPWGACWMVAEGGG